MKTAIIMPTIRAQAGRVAELFLHDAASNGLDLRDVAMYFSVDPPLSVDARVIQLRAQYASRLRLVRYIDRRRRVALAQELFEQCQIGFHTLENLLIRRGYASARNAGLVEAIKDGNEFAINIDDDLFPIVPRVEGNGRLEWLSSNVIHLHLTHLTAGADITRGSYLGYNSPLIDLSGMLPKLCRKALGLALSLGNEVLAPDCLTNPPPVRVKTDRDRNDTPFEHGSSSKGMVIYGGNVGVSLLSLMEGRVPTFFCPQDARGEDTFFGLFLPGAARVDTVPAFLFHDPFRLYSSFADGGYPNRLKSRVEPTQANLQRFADAFRGWVAYAPLWIRTQIDDPQRRSETLALIARIYRNHSSCLEMLGLEDVVHIFQRSIDSMEVDFELLNELDRLWRTRIGPCASTETNH